MSNHKTTQQTPKIEVFTVCHKPAFIPDNSLLKPIQVGVSLSGNKLEGMAYYDNEGENISDRNKSYCEMTAVYWAWKNVEADYYGLFHYRRYLSFAPDTSDNPYAGKAFSTIPSALDELQLDEEYMRKTIEQYDLIVPRKDNTKATTGEASLYDQYKNEHYIKDLDYCLDYARSHYDKIAPYVDVTHQSEAYYCNMFIMKKELFDEYCTFMFDVLESFEKHNDISGYNMQQYRVTGFIAERLTNIFIHYVIGTGKYKVKELQTAYFENTEPTTELKPIKKDAIAVVLAADDYYVPYVSTLIGSLAEAASDKNFYDINIFNKDITPSNQQLLTDQFKDKKNISIRFCDMSGRADEFSNLATKWHITIETYFRLFIQDVMTDYDKVLYLDGDMVVKRDVAELFKENIDGYLLAACRDVDMAGVYSSNAVKAENTINPKMKEHIDAVVKLKNPYDYFQAGVILFNLKEMRKQFTVQQLLKIAGETKWEYFDQDILNHVADGKVKYLDPRWNVLYDWEFVRIKNVISKAPIKMYEEYMASRKNPYIIHYGGTIKPWQRADTDMASEYWKVARKSVFYELILSRMTVWATKHQNIGARSQEQLRLRTRVVRKLRRTADKVAPKGTLRRKPLTALSRTAKRIIP